MGLSNEAHAFAAGLIDGEGYVAVVNRPDRRAGTPVICVEMTSHEVIIYLRDTFNLGAIHRCKKREKHHKQSWKWQVKYRQAHSVARKIYPYAIEKKDKIYCILQYYPENA